MKPIELTDGHLATIREAVTLAYDKLRWHVGDSAVLRHELYVLARASYLEGMRQATIPERDL